jgi:hypothetical protein
VSIKPLETRLNEVTAAVSEDPRLPEDEQALPDPLPVPELDAPENEPVQVAGLASGLRALLKPGAKMKDAPPVQVAPAQVQAPQQIDVPQPAPPPPPKTAPTVDQFLDQQDLARGGKPSDKPIGTAFNYDLYNTPEGIDRAIETLAKMSDVNYQRITVKEAKERAVALGIGPDYIATMEATAGELKDLPVTVTRALAAMATQTKKLNDLAGQINKSGATPELTAEWLQEYALSAHVMQQAKNIQVAPAQALAVLNGGRPVLNTIELQKLAQNPEVSRQVADAAQAFNALTTEAAQGKLVDKFTKVGFAKDLWLSTWINGLLSGLGTQAVNITSSTAFALTQPFVRLGAGTIGGVRRMVTGADDGVYAGEALAGLAGYVQAIPEAMHMFWLATRYGTTREQRVTGELLDLSGKTEARGGAAGLDAAEYGFEGKLATGLTYWSRFVAVPGRVLQSTDEAFKALGYRFEVNARAYREGESLRRQLIVDGVDPDIADLKKIERIQDIRSNPPEDIELAAMDFGKMLTFSRDLDGFPKTIQDLTNSSVIAKTMMPFVRTPTWLISEGTQHSPFAVLSKQWRNDIAAGGAQRDLAMAKFGMGSMAMVGLSSLAVEGRITGSGPGNPQLRATYQREGWRPYSIVFKEGEWDEDFKLYLSQFPGMDPSIGQNGNLYVSFRGFEPVSAVLAMAADYTEYARYEDDDDEIAQVGLGALFGLYQYMGNSPFMQTLSGMVGAIGSQVPNPRQAMKDVINEMTKAGTGYLIDGSPAGAWSSMQAQIERNVEGVRKDITAHPDLPVGVKGFYEAWLRKQSRVPGLSASLPNRLNRWAETDLTLDPARPWLSNLGIRTNESKMQEVDRVLIALRMPLAMPPRAIEKNGARVKLDTDQYNRLLTIYAKETIIKGKGVQDALVARAKDPAFAMLDLDEQQTLIKEVDNDFMKRAREVLISEDINLQTKLESDAFKKGSSGLYKQ